MPPKYTAEEIAEQKKVAEQLRKIDLFLQNNPGYKPYTFENDFNELKLIKYMKSQIQDMLVEGLYVKEMDEMMRFLNLREKVVKQHVARPIANFNVDAEENSKELNKLANLKPANDRPAKRAKRGGGRATRKRRGTRRA